MGARGRKGIVGRLDNSGCILYNETNAGKGTSSNDFYDSQMSEESTAYREQPAGERRTYRSCEYIPEHRTEILCRRIGRRVGCDGGVRYRAGVLDAGLVLPEAVRVSGQ